MDKIDNVVVSSFNHDILQEVSRLNSKIKIGLLVYSRLLDISEYMKILYPIYSVHLASDFTDIDIVREIKKTGSNVYVWTVDEKEEAELFYKMGVDGIFTNYPDLMRK